MAHIKEDPEEKKNHSSFQISGVGVGVGDEEDFTDNSPIEEVRLTVPITDDPTEPALTFRTWFLGLISLAMLAFVNQFFEFRQNTLSISTVSAQIITLPLGRLMAAKLPTTKLKVPLTNWSFSLNPGPFTLKEHVLITILAGAGSSGVYAVNIIAIVKAFYKRQINPFAAFLLAQTTQMLGYGWAGVFRRILVDSPYMWWPANLVQVSLFRALHEKEGRIKGTLTRLQFFLVMFIASFAYYLIPGYLFPSISSISFACFIWKDKIIPQQIGSGLKGLGIGAFTLDWSTVAGFLGSPLAYPSFAIINTMFGFVLFVYIINPIAYYTNSYDAKRFPIYSSKTYDHEGHIYNISRILNKQTFTLDIPEYDGYSKIYLSIFFAFAYGLSFASLPAVLSYVWLNHGKEIFRMWKATAASLKEEVGDVHTRLMKRNYEPVPNWWFYIILVAMLALSILSCEGFGKQLQLPWWGILLACAMALFFTLPIGIITATTNQQPGLNVITELVIGFMYPGRPLANVTFKTYGYISMTQAIYFLSDFKLGHYMKIPPRSMFIVQTVGTLLASTIHFSTAWYLLTSIENICNTDLLPDGSPWTCPGDEVFYNASIIWGVVGPGRMFTRAGVYGSLNWFFLIGFLAPIPVWYLAKKFPNKKWIKQIHVPLILTATSAMPPARSINYTSWTVVGLFFNYYIYNKYKQWWARNNYILSAALDAGVAFMGVFLYFALQDNDINGPEWWGLDFSDHCNVAKCALSPVIQVEGCPPIG
ncbi:oligopeptide transporter 1-like [Impatiens glandulifera]|uniref:oligopeptide transporter 1-like n=1 Tax=Impatiens glandulifera TaxID=253017 RepID=UPI001FB0EB13|nr:oligopeptide transporter 1-like [Impatiens glandulifera]